MSADTFKNKIRVRVNGILKKSDTILLVQLKSPVSEELVWMPPGGALQFGESMSRALQREFGEETGLQIEVDSLAFINELIQPPFHAVEFYFTVHKVGGNLALGNDPELAKDDQLLEDLQWMPIKHFDELNIVPEPFRYWARQSLAPPVPAVFTDDARSNQTYQVINTSA